jgi:transposase
MTERLERRYCIKFCQKLGDTQVKTIHKIQQAFGDDTMSISRIKEWFNRFKDGRTSVDSELRPGRLSTSRNDNVIDQVRTLVMQDRRITVREVAIEVEVSTGSVYSVLVEDLGLKRVSANLASASR